MTKKYTLLLTLCLAIICQKTMAQTPVDTTKSLLWRISGNGLTKPSYLFGTIHLLCPDDYRWSKVMKACFDSSEVACFEVDLGDSTIMKAAKAGTKDKSGRQLKSYFTPEEYISVRRYFLEKADLDIDTRQDSKLTSLLSFTIKIDAGCPAMVSYELNLSHAARKSGKQTASLESLQEQEDVLGALPRELLAKGIVARANGSTRGREVLQQMIAAYKQQDQALTHKIIKTSGALLMDTLVDERNRKWIPRMAAKMEQASVFFAVGAGHLGGADGVIHLLAKAGYMVIPVMSDPADTNVNHRPYPPFDMQRYLSENLHYPEDGLKLRLQGKVLVKFEVGEDGTIDNCVVTKSIGHVFDEEALRVVRHMPAWKPAMHDGKPVKADFTLPVNFKLD